MIAAAFRAKLREKGPAATALDLGIMVGSLAWYTFLAGLLVAIAAPIVVFEVAMSVVPEGCRCVNSFDECRCGRGTP